MHKFGETVNYANVDAKKVKYFTRGIKNKDFRSLTKWSTKISLVNVFLYHVKLVMQ